MRKYVFWGIFLLLVGGAISVFSQSDQGYILFSLGNTTVETTLWLVLVAIVIVSIIIWFFARFLYILWGYPTKLTRGIARINHSGRKKSVERMLLAHFSGNYSKSEKYATQFKDEELSTVIGQVVRIEAMMQQGKLGIAEQLLKPNLVADHDKQYKNIFQCLQMQLALNIGRYDQVEKIYKQLPKSVCKQERWQHIYWQGLLALGKIQLLVTQLPSPFTYSGNKKEVISGYYQKSLQYLLANENKESNNLIYWFWKRIPPKLQQQRLYAESYVRFLLRQKDYVVLEQCLCRFASITELGPVMQYWGDFPAPKVRASLKTLEKLYNANDSQWLSLALGKLCLDLQLWGKAENYLRTTLDNQTDQELKTIILITLAKLYYQMGDKDQATNYLSQVKSVHLLPSVV